MSLPLGVTLLGFALAGAPALANLSSGDGRPDRVDTRVEAEVLPGLDLVRFEIRTVWTPVGDRPHVPVVLGAERYRVAPSPLPPAMEPLLFRRGFRPGGFQRLAVTVDEQPCRAPPRPLEDGSRWMACGGPVKAGEAVTVVARGELVVPERYGPFGRRGRQITLGARWYPVVSIPGRAPSEGRISLRVRMPGGFAAVAGGQFFPWRPGRSVRELNVTMARAASAPLVILPPETVAYSASGGSGAVVFPRGRTERRQDQRRRRAFGTVLDAALNFLAKENLPLSAPLLLVEAPLRRDLARSLEGGVILVSDRAYRFFKDDRLDAFHDRSVLREVFLAAALQGAPRRPGRWPAVSADAVAASLVDVWTEDRGRKQEDAFDVLGVFAFVPAIDSLLYAPQIPFVEAYFRVIREDDRLRAQLTGYPSLRPRGKVLYEKLADRAGFSLTQDVLRETLNGTDLRKAVERLLRGRDGPGPETFLDSWLSPYPDVRYRLGEWSSQRVGGEHQARVEVFREGAVVSEPVSARLETSGGERREVQIPAGPDELRVLTATLTGPLSSVTIDPRGRLSQVGSIDAPNPRLDDRSHPGWRVLLNSFNVLLGATAGAVDASLNLSFARRFDPTWRFGVSGTYAPEAVSLSGSATRGLGAAVTPNQRSAWLGLSVTADRLLEGFVAGAGAAWAARGQLTFGYDDRATAWAPEPATGFRARLGYARVLSRDGPAPSRETDDALSLGLAGLRSVRLGAAHTFSVRARMNAWLVGRPRPQLLFDLGGRNSVRGFRIGEEQGRLRGVLGGEWLHPLARDLEVDAFSLVWADRMDGALFADIATIGNSFDDLGRRGLRADIGYGLRIYLSYLGVRPGVMAVDVAFPVLDDGRWGVGAPEVYVAFTQSFRSL